MAKRVRITQNYTYQFNVHRSSIQHRQAFSKLILQGMYQSNSAINMKKIKFRNKFDRDSRFAFKSLFMRTGV